MMSKVKNRASDRAREREKILLEAMNVIGDPENYCPTISYKIKKSSSKSSSVSDSIDSKVTNDLKLRVKSGIMNRNTDHSSKNGSDSSSSSNSSTSYTNSSKFGSKGSKEISYVDNLAKVRAKLSSGENSSESESTNENSNEDMKKSSLKIYSNGRDEKSREIATNSIRTDNSNHIKLIMSIKTVSSVESLKSSSESTIKTVGESELNSTFKKSNGGGDEESLKNVITDDDVLVEGLSLIESIKSSTTQNKSNIQLNRVSNQENNNEPKSASSIYSHIQNSEDLKSGGDHHQVYEWDKNEKSLHEEEESQKYEESVKTADKDSSLSQMTNFDEYEDDFISEESEEDEENENEILSPSQKLISQSNNSISENYSSAKANNETKEQPKESLKTYKKIEKRVEFQNYENKCNRPHLHKKEKIKPIPSLSSSHLQTKKEIKSKNMRGKTRRKSKKGKSFKNTLSYRFNLKSQCEFEDDVRRATSHLPNNISNLVKHCVKANEEIYFYALQLLDELEEGNLKKGEKGKKY